MMTIISTRQSHGRTKRTGRTNQRGTDEKARGKKTIVTIITRKVPAEAQLVMSICSGGRCRRSAVAESLFRLGRDSEEARFYTVSLGRGSFLARAADQILIPEIAPATGTVLYSSPPAPQSITRSPVPNNQLL